MANKRAAKKVTEDKIKEDVPVKSLLRVDEVAAYFDVSTSSVYTWIDHGILEAEKYRGIIRIPRESVINCRIAHRLKKGVLP